MELSDAIGIVAGWLHARADTRPPVNLAEALWTVAAADLAAEVGAFWAERKTHDPAGLAVRRDQLTGQSQAFFRRELDEMPPRLREEIALDLLVVAQEGRHQVGAPVPQRFGHLRERLARRLARGLFGAYLRPPLDRARQEDDSWGRLLGYIVSRSLVGEAIRFGQTSHPARVPSLDKRLFQLGHDPEDLTAMFVQCVYAAPWEYRGVAATIGYLVSRAAHAWVDLVRQSGPSGALVGGLDLTFFPARSAFVDPDIPATWDGCQSRFAPRGDAVRLLFLRLLRGELGGPLDPADCGWLAVRDVVANRDTLRAHQGRLNDAGTTEDVVAVFHPPGPLGAADALLLETRDAITRRRDPSSTPGDSQPNWPIDLLASYYFLALLPPDTLFPTYPTSQDAPLSGNAALFWLVDFLRHGYHLQKAQRSTELPGWSEVRVLLERVDDLVAAHRLIRVTRLPAGVCWCRLDELATRRALNEAALRQFYSRQSRQSGLPGAALTA